MMPFNNLSAALYAILFSCNTSFVRNMFWLQLLYTIGLKQNLIYLFYYFVYNKKKNPEILYKGFQTQCIVRNFLQVIHHIEMNFLRNRLVMLGLMLLATLLLYLLLPSIRQDNMEPSNEARIGPPILNVSIRTGQLPGDPPLFFREALPVDREGQQILPK